MPWLAAATELELRQSRKQEASGSQLDGANSLRFVNEPGR